MVPRYRHWTTLVAVALAAACAGSASTTTEVSPSAGATSGATRPATVSPTRSANLAAASNPTSTWPTYHRIPSRAGDAGATLPILTGGLAKLWTATLDGAVYAEPILVGSNAVVATENDSVYALSLATGHQVWRRHLGTPVPRSALPCGNIDPLGITGTPTYDPATGSVFVVTETTGAVHTLWALAATTGAVRWHRGLDVLSSRDRHAQQQRSALLVTAGRVVTAFGGLWGDCGNYVGYVTSVPTSGQGSTTVYAVPTRREAGMWAAGGPALGPNGLLYVASGNGAATGGGYDGSDSVLALNATTMKRVALFAPSTWASDNAQDLDLGSLAPAPVAGRIVIAGKRGVAYLLASNLGGVGGQLASRSGCTAFGGSAVRGSTVFLPCTAGIRALRVGATSLAWSWQAAGIPGSPVLAGSAVYALNPSGQRFYELSISTGQVLRSLALGVAISRFATPTVANGGRTVLVPTMRGVIAVV